MNPSIAIATFGPKAFLLSFSTLRAQGPLVSAGGSSSAMAIGVVILVGRSIAGRSRKWNIVCLMVLTMGLFMNFTRTYVFILIVFVGAVFAYYKRLGLLAKIGAVIVVSALIVGSAVGWSHITDRFRDLPGAGEASVSENQMFQGRVLLTGLILDDFRKSDAIEVLFGKGLYNSNRVLQRYFGVEASTHNDLLWLVSNCGLIGLILYLGVILSLVFGHRGNFYFLYGAFVALFVFLSGLGGETIAITGHRYLQMIGVALLARTKSQNGSVNAVGEERKLLIDHIRMSNARRSCVRHGLRSES
jgi:O-antigen ligase